MSKKLYAAATAAAERKINLFARRKQKHVLKTATNFQLCNTNGSDAATRVAIELKKF